MIRKKKYLSSNYFGIKYVVVILNIQYQIGNRNAGGNRNGNRTNGGNRNGGNRRNQNQNRPTSSTASESYCAGGSLQECIRFCPSDESGSEFSTCVTDCGNQCPN